ncbi:hypothetical protein GYMLUDRAFT_475525 [Collybiopsis luxurians FD-317 M1]|uniref:Uncharacterized protein n=1 Tax=Collybiopsis luxurians FD-317 M1 TaxID=944289 RepID=A0A0D0D1K8_9AGAR|nr:hypothetical protein GYMLUDRAFT_475525 [Collybiopsis luxurians FD-317 M1]
MRLPFFQRVREICEDVRRCLAPETRLRVVNAWITCSNDFADGEGMEEWIHNHRVHRCVSHPCFLLFLRSSISDSNSAHDFAILFRIQSVDPTDKRCRASCRFPSPMTSRCEALEFSVSTISMRLGDRRYRGTSVRIMGYDTEKGGMNDGTINVFSQVRSHVVWRMN